MISMLLAKGQSDAEYFFKVKCLFFLVNTYLKVYYNVIRGFEIPKPMTMT